MDHGIRASSIPTPRLTIQLLPGKNQAAKIRSQHQRTVRVVTPSSKGSPIVVHRIQNERCKRLSASPTPPEVPVHRVLTPSMQDAVARQALEAEKGRGPKATGGSIPRPVGQKPRAKPRSRREHEGVATPSKLPVPASRRVKKELEGNGGSDARPLQSLPTNVLRIPRQRHSMQGLQRKHLEQERLRRRPKEVQETSVLAEKGRSEMSVANGTGSSVPTVQDATRMNQRVTSPTVDAARRRSRVSGMHPGYGSPSDNEAGVTEASTTAETTGGSDAAPSAEESSPELHPGLSQATAGTHHPNKPTGTPSSRPHQEAEAQNAKGSATAQLRSVARTTLSPPPVSSKELSRRNDGSQRRQSRGSQHGLSKAVKAPLGRPSRIVEVRRLENGTTMVGELDVAHSDTRKRATGEHGASEFVGCVALQPEYQPSPLVDDHTWDRLHGGNSKAAEEPLSPVSPLSPDEQAIWHAREGEMRASAIRRSLTASYSQRRSRKSFRDGSVAAIAQSRMASGAEQRASLVSAPSRRIRSSYAVSHALAPARASAASQEDSRRSASPIAQGAGGVAMPKWRLRANKQSWMRPGWRRRMISPSAMRMSSFTPPGASEPSPGCWPALCTWPPGSCFPRRSFRPAASGPPHSEPEKTDLLDRHLRPVPVALARVQQAVDGQREQRSSPPDNVAAIMSHDTLRLHRQLDHHCEPPTARTEAATDVERHVGWQRPHQDESPHRYVPPIFRNSLHIAKARQPQTRGSMAGEGPGSNPPTRQTSTSAHSSAASSTPNFSRKPSHREYLPTRPSLADS